MGVGGSNFCNEKLQQIFIELTLKEEQEEYIKEVCTVIPRGIGGSGGGRGLTLLQREAPTDIYRIDLERRTGGVHKRGQYCPLPRGKEVRVGWEV